MSVIRHLRLLLWKNYLLQIRHPVVTIAELLIPCLFVGMLASIRNKVDFTVHPNATQFQSFDTNNIPAIRIVKNLVIPKWVVMYSPNSSQIHDIMHKVSRKMTRINPTFQYNIQGFESEEQMVSFYVRQEAYYQNLILCGIVFEDETKLDDELKYKLRFPSSPKFSTNDKMRPIRNWWTQFTFPLFSKPGPRQTDQPEGGVPGYYEEGFLAVQHTVAMTVANYVANKSEDDPDGNIDNEVMVLLQRFPYPPYIEDIFLLALQFLFPIILMLSFIYPAVNLTKNIVIEKEKRLKESMKMMGLKNWLHWLAWFIKSLFWLAISCALLTILITISIKEGVGILNKSNPFLIYFFFISYSMSCIAFSFLLSTFFSKANVSAVGSGVMYFIAFMPYFFFFPRYRELAFIQKLLSCLSCNSGLAMGSMIIAMWEGNSVGIQWSNLALTASPDDTLTILHVLIMFYVDTALYLCLTWYIEAVFPGEYGIPQKWYFPFTRTYWFGHKQVEDEEKLQLNGNDNSVYTLDKSDTNNSEYFEREPSGLKSGIKILNLSKTFDNKKYAVKDLQLNAYRGQITALLGHNGAGKTTTMSILTGLFPPSSGTALLNGFDIKTDIDKVRSSLGICPQFDILFDELTVEEHLLFYCKLKEFNSKQMSDEISHMIQLLGLQDKRKKASKTLSGGQKRKLSVGIALVGKSKIVILDEPTSGMDVYARRFTWELLLAEKMDRTILLSTHFMEEADVLGERIAIMANGQLQCCGSPLFLKKKYGAGYHMTIVKKSDSTDAFPITHLIQYHIIDAKLDTSAGTEISYNLPDQYSDKFEALFKDIEKKKDQLGIDSYGVSMTTMEEVFLKVRQYAEEGMEALNTNKKVDIKSEGSIGLDLNSDERNTGYTLIAQQFYALLLKKIFYTLRNPTLTVSQLLLPTVFALFVLVLLQNLPKIGDSSALVLNLDNFKGTKVPYFVQNKDNEDLTDMVAAYRSQFEEPNEVINKTVDSTNLTQSMVEFILNKSEESIGYFNLHWPIGAIICDPEMHEDCSTSGHNGLVITGLFNNQPFHAIGISLAAVDLAVIRYMNQNPDYSLEVSNHPLPRTTADKLLQVQYASPEQFQLSENLMFSMSFLAASFAVLLVKEKSIKGKHLQQVCGVKLYLFWISSFIWDFLIYITACFGVMFMYWAFNQEPLKSAEQEGRLFVVFATHGFALLPMVYLMSFLFDVPSTAYVRICLFNIIVGIGTFITVVVTELPLLDLANIGRTLDWTFSIFLPNYNLGRSVYHLYTNYLGNKYCNIDILQKTCNLGTVNASQFIHTIRTEFKEFANLFEDFLNNNIPDDFNITIPVPDVIKPCCKAKCNDTCFPWNDSYFGVDNPGIGRLLILFIIQGMVFWALIVLVELNVIRNIKYTFNRIKSYYLNKLNKNKDQKDLELEQSVDEDVRIEAERIEKTDLKKLFTTDAMIIKKLTKYYGNSCAVDHISYGVKRGECFGLLGVNGAGKTTTFKMITGDETISSGNIYVNGFNVKNNTQQVQRQIGYCPQFDGLLDQLTGKETLVLFCRLRGIKEIDIQRHIQEMSTLLYFDMHINKMVGKYSGGTKRKLSTAVALLGKPSVSFLDEPTTGVDPVARRCLWDALIKNISEGRSIVLTSHSMEECEALCSRLIIMVNGKICCIGSPQQLKNKFGKGYTVRIKVSTGLLDSNEVRSTGERRHSKIAWRQNSVISNDIVLDQNIKEVKEFMDKSFTGCELKEIHYNLLHFYINDNQLTQQSWAYIFGTIERAKETLNIEDYSVGQTSLEQIFLSFASKQKTS